MAQITVIIPNYKGINFIEECLGSLYAQEKGTPDFEVLVVDNASADGSVALIRERFPRTRLICLESNTGFCHAVNVGIQNSDSPFVLLLNNDTKVYPDFVKKLYACMKHKSVFSVSACMLMWDRPELIDDAGDEYCLLGWAYGRGKGREAAQYARRKRVFSACGGAALYRRDLLLEIGLFDENHFAYLEDLDLGYRARIHGYENLYEPGAKVIHYGSASTGSRYNEWKTRRAAANNVYVIFKNMPLVQLIINLPFLLVGFLIKFLFFVKKKMGGLYLKGLLDGIRLCCSKAGREKKVPYERRHLWNYCKIQLLLIKGIWRA